MNCKNCKKQGCSLAGKNHEMSFECRLYIGKTNADRIRAMTDRELAQEIWSCHIFASFADLLDWLKEEAKE